MVLTVSVIYGCLARNPDRNNDGLRDSFLGITKSLVPVIHYRVGGVGVGRSATTMEISSSNLLSRTNRMCNAKHPGALGLLILQCPNMNAVQFLLYL